MTACLEAPLNVQTVPCFDHLVCKPSPVCISHLTTVPCLHFALDNRPRLCYTDREMKQETKIRLDPDQRAALDALAVKSGHSVAALIRWCVKNSLSVLAANIERNARRASES